MNTTTIRVTKKTHEMLQSIAQDSGLPMHDIVEQALEEYRRQLLLEAANKAYAALRSDTRAWQDWTDEQEPWDETLADGLEEA